MAPTSRFRSPSERGPCGLVGLLFWVCLLVPPRTAADDGLYVELGGEQGIARIVRTLIRLAVDDPRIGHHFEHVDQPALLAPLSAQICELAGGPCRYEGAPMADVHAGLGIREADFYVFVELLQTALRSEGVDFAAENRLLALLAPMKRDVVEP